MVKNRRGLSMETLAVEKMKKDIAEIKGYVYEVEDFFMTLNKEMKEMKNDISSIKDYIEEIGNKLDDIEDAVS